MELRGSTVMITGGAIRVGRQLAIHMAQGGANILFTYPLNNPGCYVAVQDWPSGSCWARSVIRSAKLGKA